MDPSPKNPNPTPVTSAKPSASERGKTYIADEVVSIIARIAAEEVDGVYQLGDSSLRGVMSRLGRKSGIESEVGLKEAAIDVDVVVEYGFPITKVSSDLRRQVIENVEYMTGRKVVEVNINVVDVHVPRVEQAAAKPKRQLD